MSVEKERVKMGKAARWFRGLLGMKKDKENADNMSPRDRKEKKRWSFGKPMKESPAAAVAANSNSSLTTDPTWLRSYMSASEKEQNKHAIAVAAATAAAADAAVAAAQAAVAVVRLTSHGRGTLFGGGRERWAAVKIQTVFRAHLARKALRALRGLVKLQALVRGFLVRKRAAATLYSMQALLRAQTAVRSQRALEIDTYRPHARSRRIHTCTTDSSEESHYYHNTSSPLPNRIPVPESRYFQDSEWGYIGDNEYKVSNTTQSTPRFGHSGRSTVAPATPTKSVCGDGCYSNHPSYMGNTKSFSAKKRSQSAPKQRPESGVKTRLSLIEIMASRSSLSGVRMQRSCSKAQEAINL
ncbi:protein of unknown function DUF4005 [Cynara cardunculus var. scolymus]|uniref:DUF4005 domain-containing protein n=1 Tax=Cynara cardunculus var. scolymus TaxID=59895 RepID=A0A103XLH4_CYNCS|nr:protein of unknown function DUF4005 [Cynara cardunculus var. scolymus]